MKKEWFLLIALGVLGLLYYFRKPIGGFIMGLWDDIYKKWADVRGLDWRLLKAVAMHESDENPNAIGDNGASIGLMQVQKIIGQAYAGVTDLTELYDPDKNVEAGSGFLKDMIDKYGVEGGIQAYNLGETKYRKGITSPDYLRIVMNNYNNLQSEVA